MGNLRFRIMVSIVLFCLLGIAAITACVYRS